MPHLRKLLLILLLFFSFGAKAQFSNFRVKYASATTSLQLDTLSILPGSVSVFCGNTKLPATEYSVDYADARLNLLSNCADSIMVTYRVFPMSFNSTRSLRDTALIYNPKKGLQDQFKITPGSDALDLLETSGLKKSGSISRGVTFGNRQNLSVNSSLNLELSGYIAPNLQILASVTDDNLPIQPEGNTSKLQEFDQVFIQLFNDQFKLQAGDFWTYKPEGYFMTYRKRGQGLTGEYYWLKSEKRTIKSQVSGALSKGKYNRQIIQGVEGNQGPYRLTGAENEPYITVLSGTERVFIDGRQLTRGQEYDYVIDYNTSELTFTARQLITKDSRIVVEFQYSDQNYARSFFQFSTSSMGEKYDWWFNAYSEQDSKNQPLQQTLSSQQKFLLSNIGDDLNAAQSVVIDSLGYNENQVMYKLIDTLGFDSVLVFSVDPVLAAYKVTFSFVGAGNGDYVFREFNALGKVYQWIEPIGGISQGDYAPVTVLVTPKKRSLVTAGGVYRISDKWSVMSEIGMSGNDKNTFSRLDSYDDRGFSVKSKIEHSTRFGRDSVKVWKLTTRGEVEALDPYFQTIEQYRAVEFDRDWNTRNKGYTGNQVYSVVGTTLGHQKYGTIGLEAQQYKYGSDFEGYRGRLTSNWRRKGLTIIGDASALSSHADGSNIFFRHKLDLSQRWGKVRIGYKADQEHNRFYHQDTLLNTSYSFFDYQEYASFGDTTGNEVLFSYRERIDQRSDSTRLQNAAKARTISASWTMNKYKNQRLVVVMNYRTLNILDSTLISQAPENTTNGRIDHEIKLAKSAITLTTFYEVGAGLEQKKEFVYIKVNDGQGVYYWNDYNGDGVKDLNEFEIAAYADQASYIRVFTPSNTYTKTYSNEYNQSLMLRPERIWTNAKGMKRLLSRFSTQSRFRIQRKTSDFDGLSAYNPFIGRIQSDRLISAASNMKHTLYFNRISNIVGAEYSYEKVSSKTLLATGFDGKSNESHELSFRLNIKKEWTINSSYERGLKTSFVDYTAGRNYTINYYTVKPGLSYQPTTSLRFSLDGRFSKKRNSADFGGELATIRDVGISVKFNQAQKGSFQSQFNYVLISYNGDINTPVGFEMLEALKAGKNLVWSLGYQRNVSKNLQISIQYSGRKSENTPVIHAGGMEVKAFF